MSEANGPYQWAVCPNCGDCKLLWVDGLEAHTCKQCGKRSSAEEWRVSPEEGAATLTVAEYNRRRAEA